MAASTTSPTAAAIRDALADGAILTQTEVAAAIGKGRSTVTEVLNLLVADGTVTRGTAGRTAVFTLFAADAPAADVLTDDEHAAAADAVGDARAAEYTGAVAEAAFADAPTFEEWTATADPAPLTAADTRPVLTLVGRTAPPACHCGDDTVGHVHPARDAGKKEKAEKRPARAPRTGGTVAGKSERARAAALAALTAAGPAGIPVPAVWDAMQTTAGMAHQGAYALLNTMTTEGLIVVSGERKVRDRRATLATIAATGE